MNKRIEQPDRRPKNKTEGLLWDKMTEAGWDLTKKGWPDYACFKDGKFIMIEVKPKRSHRLKRRQYQIMKSLAQYGAICYRWSPDTGFEQIMPDKDSPLDK